MPPPQDEAANQRDIAHFLVAGAGGGDGRFHAFRAGDFHGLGSLGGSFGNRQLSMLDPGADPEAARRFLHQMPYGLTISRAAARHHVDALSSPPSWLPSRAFRRGQYRLKGPVA